MSLFVTFDGPNGSGKTTMINSLKTSLEKEFSIYQTREPSNTEFGRYVKKNEHSIRGLAYAFLITAERAYHYDTEVKDALKENDIVLCDRYIGSSLALQVFDGVNIDKIWDVNKDFLMPDLGIFMIASEGELTSRLMARHELSFFEKEMKRSDEIHYYNLAYETGFQVNSGAGDPDRFLLAGGFVISGRQTSPAAKTFGRTELRHVGTNFRNDCYCKTAINSGNRT